MKLLTIILTFLFLAPLVFALDECKGKVDPGDVPCLIFLPTPTSCGSVSVDVYEDNNFLDTKVMHQYTGFYCNATFNYSTPGTYTFEYSTGDTGSLTVEVNKMIIASLLLIPLGLGFLFLYWGNTLNDEQEGLKWFTRLLAVLMIFPLFVGANIVITQGNLYPGLTTLFNLTWLTWIFYTLVAVVLIYIIWRVYNGFQIKRAKEFEEGILK